MSNLGLHTGHGEPLERSEARRTLGPPSVITVVRLPPSFPAHNCTKGNTDLTIACSCGALGLQHSHMSPSSALQQLCRWADYYPHLKDDSTGTERGNVTQAQGLQARLKLRWSSFTHLTPLAPCQNYTAQPNSSRASSTRIHKSGLLMWQPQLLKKAWEAIFPCKNWFFSVQLNLGPSH